VQVESVVHADVQGGRSATFVLVVIFMTVVLPLVVVMHYVTKWKATKGLSDDEQKLLEDLWRDSQSMQSRVNALETILDDEVPDWRKQL
jgi:phage shock protein B